MSSPTVLTLARLRRDGFTADPVERFIAGAGENGQGIRRDWGHFGDVLACHPGRGEIVLIQTTTLPNLPARVAKTQGQPAARAWLAAGGKIVLQGWTRRATGWSVKIIQLQPGDLAGIITEAPPRKRPRSRWQPPDLFAD